MEEGVGIGANSTIRCGITLARWSMVGCGSTVTADVPPHALVVGNPARIVAWMSPNGKRLVASAAEGIAGGTFKTEDGTEEVTLEPIPQEKQATSCKAKQ